MPAYNEQINELEERISKTKYNKHTQGAIGLYKAQLAKLRDKQEARGSKKGATETYAIRKTGDGTVVLLGFPSVGKSTLLNGITNAHSAVAAYEFTTLKPVPGLLEYNYAKIQILDMPGIVRGAASGRGRGKEVLACLMNADLILILLDVNHPEHYDAMKEEVWNTNVRINQKKPDVKIIKRPYGGLHLGVTVPLTHLTRETISIIAREFKINNADIVIREDITDDQLIDIIEGQRKYVPAIVVLNKIDTVSADKLSKVIKSVHPDISISASEKEHLEELKALIYDKLDLMRIFLKEPGKEADMEIPLIISYNSAIRDVCSKLHKDFVAKFRFARVWGKSSKFPGQKLMLNHVLFDKDILELHIK
jgi:small GTP-binding protein